MIAILDYGLGNIKSFVNIYKRLGINVSIAHKESDLDNVSKLILPGVGHFDYAMKKFSDSGMREKTSDLVMNAKVPVLGICVGMQILANKSEEGVLDGLGWVDAVVNKFDASKPAQSNRLPHMGWNDVQPTKKNKLFESLELQSRFYFLHSYYFSCHNSDDILAETSYGIKFSCAINHNNVYGVQFHPEKSHHFGIQLLKNFANI
jgi:glutamine amidotransferase